MSGIPAVERPQGSKNVILSALVVGFITAAYFLTGACQEGSGCSTVLNAIVRQSAAKAVIVHEEPRVFQHVTGSPWLTFRALRSQAISTRRCIEYWALGREAPGRGPYATCELSNVYLDATASENNLLRLVYLHEVDAAANETVVTAELEAVNMQLHRMKAVAMVHDEVPSVEWRVVVVRAAPHPALAFNESDVVGCSVSAGSPVFDNATNLVQPSDPAAANGGCWATVHQPTAFMQRPPPQNIGHWTWDGMLPLMGALIDLGLPPELYSQLQLIVFDHPLHVQFYDSMWPSSVVLQATAGIMRHPTFLSVIRKQAADLGHSLIRLPMVVLGQGGRSPHDFPPQYALRDAPKHVVWSFRQAALKGMGLAAEDRPRASADPLRIVLLQKPDKRIILFMDDIVAAAKAQLASDGFVAPVITVLDWTKNTSSYQEEVRTLMATDILMSVDGTGANNLFYMPPGAVFISLGVRDPYGAGNQADFIFTSVDHVAVLYYPPLPAGGHDDDITLDVPLTADYILRAARLVRAGFKRPLPWKLNHSPAGYATQHLFSKYLPLNIRGWDMYAAHSSSFMHMLRNGPVGMWAEWARGEPMPANLTGDVADADAERTQLHASWELSLFGSQAAVDAFHSTPRGSSSRRLRSPV